MLHEGAGEAHAAEAGHPAGQVAAADVPTTPLGDVTGLRAVRDERVGQAGEQVVERHQSTRLEAMGVLALRDTLAVVWSARQGVAVEDGHAVVVRRHRSGSHEATHAGSDDHCVLAPSGVLARRGHVSLLVVGLVPVVTWFA